MNPIIYDFKRSFFRVSVLSLLVLFILAGVGLTYLAYHVTIPFPSVTYNLNFVSVVNYTKPEFAIIGLVFDNSGNPISGADVYIYIRNVTITSSYVTTTISATSVTESLSMGPVLYGVNATTNPQGVFNISFSYTPKYPSFFICIKVVHNGLIKTSSKMIYTGIVTTTYVPNEVSQFVLQNVSSYYYARNLFPYMYIFGYNGHSARLIMAGYGDYTLYFKHSVVYSSQAINSTPTLGIVSVKVNGVLDKTINVPSSTTSVIVVSNSYPRSISITTFHQIPPIERSTYASVVGSISLFIFGFSILFIYLAYALFGRLKNAGLDFIISRPITRIQFLLTRYFAGTLALLVAIIVFLVSLGIATVHFFSFLPTFLMLYLFPALFVYILIWYTIEYLLSVYLSPVGGLGLGIGLYFLLGLLFGILSFIFPKYSNALTYYVTPSSLLNLIEYYVENLKYPSVNVGITIVAQLLWLIIPLFLAIQRFKKMDI